MTDRELMQQALDVMLAAIKAGDWKVDGACDPDMVLEALRARLAQPEPESVDKAGSPCKEFWDWLPKAYRDGDKGNEQKFTKYNMEVAYLAGTRSRREWQGLTTQEIADETDIATSSNKDIFDLRKAFWCGARWAEDKLKEKNA